MGLIARALVTIYKILGRSVLLADRQCGEDSLLECGGLDW